MGRIFNSALIATAAVMIGLPASVSAQPKPTPAPADQQSCIFPRNISSFSAPNDHTVYLRVGVNDYYRLDITGPCQDINFALGVELKSYRGEVAICSPLDAEVVVHLSGELPAHCPIQTIHKLSPAEVALLGKNKP